MGAAAGSRLVLGSMALDSKPHRVMLAATGCALVCCMDRYYNHLPVCFDRWHWQPNASLGWECRWSCGRAFWKLQHNFFTGRPPAYCNLKLATHIKRDCKSGFTRPFAHRDRRSTTTRNTSLAHAHVTKRLLASRVALLVWRVMLYSRVAGGPTNATRYALCAATTLTRSRLAVLGPVPMTPRRASRF